MKMFHRILAGLALMGAAAVSSAPASAQQNWGGLYGGAHIGYGSTNLDYTAGFAATAAGPFTNANNFSHDPDGFVAGGQVGLQHQWQNIVAGIEVSFTNGSHSTKRDTPLFPGYVHEAEFRSVYTVVGRLGYAWGSNLLYIKGGYAGALVDMDYNKAQNPAFVTAANRVHADGWTAGVGFEHMWKQGVSLGLEYNYHALDADVRPLRLANGNFQSQSNIDLDIHTVTARLNFHLHRPAPAAAPMK